MELVRIPQTNVNDTHVDVVNIAIASGSFVSKETELFDIETTKALFTVDAPCSGFVHHRLELSKQYRVGELSCIISNDELSEAQIEEVFAESSSSSRSLSDTNRLISNRARLLIEDHDISISSIPGTGTISYVNVLEYLRETRAQSSDFYQYLESSDLTDTTLLVAGDPNLALIAASFMNIKDVIYLSFPDIFSLAPDQQQDLEELNFRIRVLPNDCIDRGISYILLSPLNVSIYSKMQSQIGSCSSNAQSVKLISDKACISEKAKIGDNVLIAPFSYVGPFATIEDGCVLLPGASVAHHSSIGRCCSLSDGSTIGGNVILGQECLVGLNSSVNRRVILPNGYILASGDSLHNDPE